MKYLYKQEGKYYLVDASSILDADSLLKSVGVNPSNTACEIRGKFPRFRKESFIRNERFWNKQGVLMDNLKTIDVYTEDVDGDYIPGFGGHVPINSVVTLTVFCQ